MGRAVDQLRAMRHVLEHDEGEGLDVTALQRACRQWFFDNLNGFMERKSRLEEAALAARAKAKKEEGKDGWDGQGTCPTCGRRPDAVELDEGTQRVAELLSDEWALVQEFKAKHAGAKQVGAMIVQQLNPTEGPAS